MTHNNSDMEQRRIKRSRLVSVAVSSLIAFLLIILALKVAFQIFPASGMNSADRSTPENIPVKVQAIPGFSCPVRMQMGRMEEVRLVVSPKLIRGHVVKSIRAELKAGDKKVFTITSLTPAEQSSDSATTAGWKWKVMPEKWGKHELLLRLNIFIHGKNKIKNLEQSWSRRVEVDYDRGYWMFRWRWVLIGCGVLIAAVLVDNLRKRVKKGS